MKKIVLPVIVALICALLAVAAMQWRRIDSLQREMTAAKSQLAAKEQAAAADAAPPASAHDAAVQEESNAVRQRLARVAPNAVLPPGMPTLPTEPATSPAPEPKQSERPKADGSPKPPNDLATALGRMFTDPKMKDAMSQQELVAARLMYGELAHELKLNPEEAEQVISLLAERKTAKTARTMSMLDPSAGGASLEEIGKATLEVEAEYQRRLKTILGGDRYAQFEGYEKTVGDRMLLTQFQQTLLARGTPLDEGQKGALLKIMAEARLSAPQPAAAGRAPVGVMSTEERMRVFQTQIEELNQRVVARAKSILTPEQSVAFEKILADWAQTQRAGVQMSRALFQGGR